MGPIRIGRTESSDPRNRETKACRRRSRKRGFRQIVIDRVISRVDIDTANGRRLVAIDEVDKLKRAKRLDLIVGRQLLPIPPSAERADESNGGLEQVGLDYNEIDARQECVELRINEFKAGSQTTPIEFHSHVLCSEIGPDGGVLPIDCDRQAVRHAQIVLDLAKG